MTDPYQVLGVSRSASDDEIKKAYRSLSRKYHPDANVNNPNKEQAEERFKQVQQAYDQIMKEKQQGYSYGGGQTTGGYQTGGFGGFGGFESYTNGRFTSRGEENPKMQAAVNYIRNRYYEQAIHVLNDIPFHERSARWFYYSAVAQQASGNTATALEHARMAVQLEPSNIQYQQFKQHLEFGGTWYSSMGRTYERPYSGYGSFCLSLLCMNLLCGTCCRPF